MTTAALAASAATAVIVPAAWGAGGPQPVVALGTQAESFQLDPQDGRAFADEGAAESRALAIWSEGAAVGTVDAARPSGALVLRVRGDQCEGPPLLTVAVDGQKAATVAVANRGWASMTLPGEWSQGSHQVALSFDNDRLTDACDRNVRIDQVSFSGATVEGVSSAAPSASPAATSATASAGAPAEQPDAAVPSSTSSFAAAARASASASAADGAATTSTVPAESAAPVTSASASTASTPASSSAAPSAASASATTPAATAAPTASATATAPAPVTATTAPSAASAGGSLSGTQFWVDPDSDARKELARRSGDGAATAALAKIADAPGSVWLGDWQSASQAQARAQQVSSAAAAAGQVPVFVLYAIPGRDCGGYSAGGLGSPEAYAAWVRAVASGVGGRKAVVVVEPDALAQEGCLSEGARGQRSAMLRDAVSAFAGTGATTYLDAGHSGWVDPGTMAARLKAAGIDGARGFSLNVSNFNRTSDEEAYGEQLSALLGGKTYVVDTGRNGNGPGSGALAWCNPGGRAVGATATSQTGAAHADAYLWIKSVGQSDGDCGRSEPSAGTWWPDYAIGLAARS